MLRLSDALKVIFNFFFFQSKRTAIKRIQKIIPKKKGFKRALMQLKTTLINEYKSRLNLQFKSGYQSNDLVLSSLYFICMLTLKHN